ncbi:hypothetical protein LRR81_04330 [Metabacillus sp. GX 13764]|uniref:hypothetical protein n=1 Tax=Metabacillus kandeliae TaxID=2900151 RepID=UPI001E4367E0|nr:hypothetical protein [Metabacillus kandeliae]MCD7033447.1 hypothetical protein [Metabacillus kandeliae]
MFDPTIFDNLKVLLEGAVYDLDLNGDLVVQERKDLVNLADMSRQYRIKFSGNKGKSEQAVEFELSMANEAMQKEWNGLAVHTGCRIFLLFTYQEALSEEGMPEEQRIREIWGDEVSISHQISIEKTPAGKIQKSHLIKLDFGRLINEDNAEDLEKMVRFALVTLEK